MAATCSVFAICHVAEILREDQRWLDDIAIEMEPADGRLTVWGSNATSTIAFTAGGTDRLRQLVEEHRKLSGEHDLASETDANAVLG
jgi:hypothetical protein